MTWRNCLKKKRSIGFKTKDWYYFFFKKKWNIGTEMKYQNYFFFFKKGTIFFLKKETKDRNNFFLKKRNEVSDLKRRIGTISFLKKKQRIGSETKDRNYFFFLKKRNEVSGLKRRIGTISFLKKKQRIGSETKDRWRSKFIKKSLKCWFKKRNTLFYTILYKLKLMNYM